MSYPWASVCGSTLRLVLIRNFPTYQHFELALVDYLRPALKEEPGLALAGQTRRLEWVVTTIYSLLLGTVCSVMLNRFTPRQWALQRSVGPFYSFLLKVQQEAIPVSLTLNTGKVYIGIGATSSRRSARTSRSPARYSWPPAG
jgi:hypothetical protein